MKSLMMQTNEATMKRSDASEVQGALFGCREKNQRRTKSSGGLKKNCFKKTAVFKSSHSRPSLLMSLHWCHPRCWAELVHNAYVVAYVSVIDTLVCKSLPTSKVFSHVTPRPQLNSSPW